ncbi:hypothetical protein CIHG_07521 [Coccidioides immitis H538.4]|uniref:Uncharacterized protein n=1 Tax=Coccidioides immitis H538.4 TaxID=396776 RepID=A0A0J8UQJ9_COCIT|nr:hypothetical protein CIHG_07521 [Coccidioides immitis H538.4]
MGTLHTVQADGETAQQIIKNPCGAIKTEVGKGRKLQPVPRTYDALKSSGSGRKITGLCGRGSMAAMKLLNASRESSSPHMGLHAMVCIIVVPLILNTQLMFDLSPFNNSKPLS